MSRVLMMLLLVIPVLGYATEYDSGRNSGTKALNSILPELNQINPNDYFDSFTQNPKETQLDRNTLKEQALANVENSEVSKSIVENYHTRDRVQINENSPEMEFAEKVINQADDNNNEICYKTNAYCDESSTYQTCNQRVSYINKHCMQKRQVEVKPLQTHQTTWMKSLNAPSNVTINLVTCEPGDFYCNSQQLIKLSSKCEALKAKVTVPFGNFDLKVINQPTCSNPVITIDLSQLVLYWVVLSIEVTEYETKDSWNQTGCDNNQANYCITKTNNQCASPNETRIINEIAITRDCWGKSQEYSCINAYSGCESLTKQGCSQVKSKCVSASNQRCDEFEQTYQCLTKTCFPEKTVCKEKLPCNDGSCMPTQNQPGNDFAEGVTKLGSFAETAKEVADKQIYSGEPRVFEGSVAECTKFGKGPIKRDCCTGSGLGTKISSCPKHLQTLLRAKDDNRVVELGHFKKHKLGKKFYRFCVFPNQLSAIVQLQGRYGQLGIGFGDARTPICRGLTPEELERVDFDRLDLSRLTQEFESKKVLPSSDSINKSAASKIDVMQRQNSLSELIVKGDVNG